MYLGLLWCLNVNKLAKASKLGVEINSLDNPALAQLARGDDDIDYDLDDDDDDCDDDDDDLDDDDDDDDDTVLFLCLVTPALRGDHPYCSAAWTAPHTLTQKKVGFS